MKLIRTNQYRLIILLLAALGMTSPAFAATSNDDTAAQDIKQETMELLQALKAYGVDQRDKALEHARTSLENMDNRIETLESYMLEHWDEMDQAARDKAQASLQTLRQQRTRVAEWYGSMKSGSSSAWGHIKEGFSSAYRALHGAWEKSEKEFSAEDKK